MTDIVERWLANVEIKARGRTRYGGQEPFTDEVIADEIQRLRAERDRLRKVARDITTFVTVEYIECSGFKCRLMTCGSCYGEENAMKYVKEGEAKLAELLAALSDTENPNG